jgi:DNA-binding NarL/FixJ family response regulator
MPLKAGARSYLTKDADRADIANALRSAVTGLSVLGPAVQASLLATATRGGTSVGAAVQVPCVTHETTAWLRELPPV